MNYYSDHNYYLDTSSEPEQEPPQTLENEIGKLLEILVMGVTGKTFSQQANLLRDSATHYSNSISKSNDNFTERLCNESEEHMSIIRSMDDHSLPAMRWKLCKTKYAIERFEEIVNGELQLRKDKDNFMYV